MAMVYISNEHKELAERLARNPTGVAKKPVFSTDRRVLMRFGRIVSRRAGVLSKAMLKVGFRLFSSGFWISLATLMASKLFCRECLRSRVSELKNQRPR